MVEFPDSNLGRQPTIDDVADRAGVSVSTVSRVLNGRTDVASRTRELVEQAIAALGYSPRVNARRLAGLRSHTVSLLFPSSYAQRSNVDLDFVLGAAEATGGRDYFFNLRTEAVDAGALRAMFRSGLVDGAILMQITADDWRVALAEAEDLPCVLIGRTETPHRLSWIDFDFEAAAAGMVDHLVHLGHRRIGFIGRPRAMLDERLGSATRLQQGYADAVLAHGLEPHQVQSDLDPLAAGQAALHLVDTVPGLTAIVATHGPASLGIMRALADRGLRVPQDVSVMSIATPRLASMSSPQLSGADFPSAELGFQAAAALLRQLDDRAAGMPPRTEQLLLPVQVSLRGSATVPGTRP